MKTFILTLMLCTAAALPAAGQTVSPDMSQDEKAVWVEFIENAGLGSQLEGIKPLMQQLISQNQPSLPDSISGRISELMQTEMQNLFVTVVIPTYSRHFTLDEIRQINNFYRTPIGKKLKEKSPQISKELVSALPEWQQKLLPKMMEIMEPYMKQKQSAPQSQ